MANTSSPQGKKDMRTGAPKPSSGFGGGSGFSGRGRGGPGRGAGGGRPGGRKGDKRGSSKKGDDRYRPEYDQKLLSIRRVARVVAGGRRFSFSVAIAIGNKQGKVGVGTGKAGDTSLAIEKAFGNARKNLVTMHLTDSKSIPHEVSAKYASSRVLIQPAPGRGLMSGSSVRSVLELAGITDVTTKLFSRTKNPLNNARVTIKALGELRAPRVNTAKNAVAAGEEIPSSSEKDTSDSSASTSENSAALTKKETEKVKETGIKL